MAGFTETDPATGAVWVGADRSVLVFDAAGTLVKTLVGKDLARDAAFDTATGRAYVVWQDGGDLSDPANDNNGTLTVYGTEDFTPAAKDLSLPGNHSQAGAASLAVEPGGATVFVTSPAEGKITRLVRQVSPLVTHAPEDLTAEEGEDVALTAEAEGTPEPSVRWQVSTDGTQTWQDVEGATEPALTFTARTAQDGYRYRAEFRNDVGTTRTAPVTLTVTPATGGDSGGDTGGDTEAPATPRTAAGAREVTVRQVMTAVRSRAAAPPPTAPAPPVRPPATPARPGRPGRPEDPPGPPEARPPRPAAPPVRPAAPAPPSAGASRAAPEPPPRPAAAAWPPPGPL